MEGLTSCHSQPEIYFIVRFQHYFMISHSLAAQCFVIHKNRQISRDVFASLFVSMALAKFSFL